MVEVSESPSNDHLSIVQGPVNDGGPKEGVGGGEEHQTFETPPLILVDESTTNESFSRSLCASTAVYRRLRSTALMNKKLLMPKCLSSAFVLGLYLDGVSLIIDDFASFPTSLEVLDVAASVLAAESLSSFGFDKLGRIDWESVFSHLEHLSMLNLANSIVLGDAPSTLGPKMSSFDCSNCGLEGTISPHLFSKDSESYLNYFRINGNKITGTIPEGLFEPLVKKNGFFTVISFADNRLSGTLPPSLLLPLKDFVTTGLKLEFQGNHFDGSIPKLPPMSLQSLELNFSKNAFRGSLPSFEDIKLGGYFTFDANANHLDECSPKEIVSSEELMPHLQGLTNRCSYNSGQK